MIKPCPKCGSPEEHTECQDMGAGFHEGFPVNRSYFWNRTFCAQCHYLKFEQKSDDWDEGMEILSSMNERVTKSIKKPKEEAMSDGMNAAEIDNVWLKARETNVAQIIKMEGDPGHVRRILKPGGKVELLEIHPANRKFNFLRVEDLIAQANKPFDSRLASEAKKRLITVGKDVYLYFNTDNGGEWGRLDLRVSEEYNFFLKRVKDPMIAVADFRTALKYQLRSTFGNEELIEQIGDINFGNKADQSQTARRGEESLGTSVVAQAASSADKGLPDERITFSVRIWDNADLDIRFPIECHLDPDPTSQRWIVYPIRESIHQFEAQNLEVLTKRISNDVKDVQIVQGDMFG